MTRKPSLKQLTPVLLMAAAAVAALSVAGSASAAVTCTYDGSSHNAIINATGDFTGVTIVRNGTAISVNGTNCGAATVSNTATIKVNGANGRQNVFINFSGGAFTPGFGADSGAAEIEFVVDLKLGTDSLELDGSSGADNFRIGAGGINFNADADLDITMPGVEELYAYGSGSGDVISAAGGLGTGGIYPKPLSLYGGDGGDTLTGGDSYNYLFGGNNNDTLNGGDSPDSLYGDAGADQLNGGNDADSLYPGLDNDVVNGGDGADYMVSGNSPDGTDVFNGGPGNDYLTYSPRTVPVTLTIDGVANDGVAGEHDNIKLDVDRVQGGQAADTITGSSADNLLDGYLGFDTLHGGQGDDNVNGGCCDVIEDDVYGDEGSDTLYGQYGPDKLYGGSGRDLLYGNAGNDLLYGESGNDQISPDYTSLADGSDNVYGGPGIDYANYYRPGGDQTITLADNTANDGLAGEKDNIHSDIEQVSGGEGNDHLIGNASPNGIFGYGGNDVIDGKDGADDLEGHDGNDTITGGDGEDYLYGHAGADSFKAQDLGYDVIYGGSDSDTDVVVNKDSFDSINEVP